MKAVGSTWMHKDTAISLGVLAAEKPSQNFVLEATNPGGHSSLPVPDNAIYHLVRAVDRISRYEFPVQLDDANRAQLAGLSKIAGAKAGGGHFGRFKKFQHRPTGARAR